MSFKNMLEKAKQENKLVSVFNKNDDGELFSIGYVHVVTESFVVLRAYSKYGEDSGYEIRSISEIGKLEMDGKYEKKIECLSQNFKNIFSATSLTDDLGEDVVMRIMEIAMDRHIMLVIWVEEPDYSLVGHVSSIDGKLATMCLVDTYGDDDGTAVVEIENIIAIDFHSKDAQMMGFLSSMKSKD